MRIRRTTNYDLLVGALETRGYLVIKYPNHMEVASKCDLSNRQYFYIPDTINDWSYSTLKNFFMTILSHLEGFTYKRETVCMSLKCEITKVIFNDPATIVYWSDNTKTVVKCQKGDKFDPEKGLAMAIAKKYYGNTGSYCDELKKWLPKG